jgi:membrane-bound lytic murein transglycosylase A
MIHLLLRLAPGLRTPATTCGPATARPILGTTPAATPCRAADGTHRRLLPPALLGAVLLAACSTPLPLREAIGPLDAPPMASAPPLAAPPGTPAPGSAPPPASVLSPPTLDAANRVVRTTPRGRWVRAEWPELPGWADDSVQRAWPALLRSCDKPHPAWTAACQSARELGPLADETGVRRWLTTRLQPWRVETAAGQPDGLLTGYFEPYLEATRRADAQHGVPLHALPAELASAGPADTRRPWYTRQQIETVPAAQAALQGRELVWLADPLDALLLHIQGSGRVLVSEPDGRQRLLRLAYAGHNQQPYQSIGRWLVDQGAFTLEQASWPAIRAWARANPQRVKEMLRVNPRYIFFREEPLPDASVGPLGAQGVPLSPGRSVAVDKDSIPYGTPVWMASTEPQPWAVNMPPARPLQRLVLAQDTGSAITGAVRADFFWGWGDGAEDRAGRTKQPLRLWALWPK